MHLPEVLANPAVVPANKGRKYETTPRPGAWTETARLIAYDRNAMNRAILMKLYTSVVRRATLCRLDRRSRHRADGVCPLEKRLGGAGESPLRLKLLPPPRDRGKVVEKTDG